MLKMLPPRMYLRTGVLWLFLVILVCGTCLGILLYKDYLQLKEENAYLQQKKMDLDKLQLALKSIQQYEATVRDLLALKKPEEVEGSFGQGGIPATVPLSIPSQGLFVRSKIPSPAKTHSPLILEKARSLQKSMQELAEIIREQRELFDRTPSIVPIDAENYRFTSGFGLRRSPFTGLKEFHDGLDISAPMGTPIIAPGEGRVAKIGRHRYRGNYLQLTHGRRRLTTYAHLSRFNVTLGQDVKRGEVIAYMGSTGRSTGSHLHYEIAINGRVVNPKYYILNAEAN